MRFKIWKNKQQDQPVIFTLPEELQDYYTHLDIQKVLEKRYWLVVLDESQ